MKSLKLGRPFRDFFSLSLIFIQFKNNNNNNHILFFNKRAIIFQKKKKSVTASYYRNHFTNLVGITNTPKKEFLRLAREMPQEQHNAPFKTELQK